MNDSETVRVQHRYDKEADRYDKGIAFFERLLFSGGREWVAAQAEGNVLEIAVGTGRNLPFYTPAITLTGIELSPRMAEIAQRQAGAVGRDIDLRIGSAEALPFPDACFDTVVCTLSLCTIPDDQRAVAEVKRVLRPGGRFVLLEHVRSPLRLVRAIQHVLDPLSVWADADHLLREPLEPLQAEGFEIDFIERTKWGIVERIIARKPS